MDFSTWLFKIAQYDESQVRIRTFFSIFSGSMGSALCKSEMQKKVEKIKKNIMGIGSRSRYRNMPVFGRMRPVVRLCYATWTARSDCRDRAECGQTKPACEAGLLCLNLAEGNRTFPAIRSPLFLLIRFADNGFEVDPLGIIVKIEEAPLAVVEEIEIVGG